MIFESQMNAKHLLRFIKKKCKRSFDDVVPQPPRLRLRQRQSC